MATLTTTLVLATPGAVHARSGDASEPLQVRIAVCQTLCIDSDLEGNLRRVEYALADAAERGADLACFAETALLGWVNPEAHALAAPIPGPITDRVAALARQHEIMIAIGVSERNGDALHDSAVLVDRDGTILLRHRKVNILPELMDPPYTPGRAEDIAVVETRLGRIGMLICADTFIDEHVGRIAAQAPDLVVVPYGWAADRERWPEHGASLAAWVRSVAARTGCAVVGTDLVGSISDGPWRGRTYGGQSIVAGADGQVLGILRDRDPDIRIFELELGDRDRTPAGGEPGGEEPHSERRP